MKTKKLLFLLILLVVVVLFISGFVAFKLLTTPQKIFEIAIIKIFDLFENTEHSHSSIKGTINYSTNYEAIDKLKKGKDLEDVLDISVLDFSYDIFEKVYDILFSTDTKFDFEIDTKKMISKQNININFKDENLLNAHIIFQDEKSYIYMPDFLDKYFLIPEDNSSIEKITSLNKNASILDRDLLEIIKTELLITILNQELTKEKTTLILNNQETTVAASSLILKDSQINAFIKDFINNLNENEAIKQLLGKKEKYFKTLLDKVLANTNAVEGKEIVFTIYTSPFLHKFIGITGKIENTDYAEATKFDLLKLTDNNYNFTFYQEISEEKNELFNLTCEKQENQILFNASIPSEYESYVFSGNIIPQRNNYSGSLKISSNTADFGTVDSNLVFDFTFGADIQKTKIKDAISFKDLKINDIKELADNFQKSNLYEFLENILCINILQDDHEITSGNHTIKFNIPSGFETAVSKSKTKTYTDSNGTSINISIIETTTDTYMNELVNNYQTEAGYEIQEISDLNTHTINDKNYAFKTVKYIREQASYTDSYFTYKLDEANCYVVKVESKEGNISTDIINNFLDINILYNKTSNITDFLPDIDVNPNLDLDLDLDLNSYKDKFLNLFE